MNTTFFFSRMPENILHVKQYFKKLLHFISREDMRALNFFELIIENQRVFWQL